MKKNILILLLVLLNGMTVFGQANATDFTATDCNSVSHNLFAELNNGKIIVLVWIMPCATCISDAIAAYDAVQSFAISHPGKVKMYLIDDVGNASCATLSAWATTNSIVPDAIFDNAGILINENDYGGGGMPHVVVVGGADHEIFFNVKDGFNNEVPITNAINQAINPTGVSETNKVSDNLTLYPNPVADNLTVSYKVNRATDVEISVINIFGTVVKSISIPGQIAGRYTMCLDIDKCLSNGVYFLKLDAGAISKTHKFTIAR